MPFFFFPLPSLSLCSASRPQLPPKHPLLIPAQPLPVPSHLGMQGAVLLSFTPCVQAACTNPQLRTFEEICFRLYELRPSQAVIIFRCHRRDLLPSGLPHAGTHPNTYTYIASPLPPRLFSLGNFGSSSLDLLCRCLSVPLAELLWALPNFPAFC